MRSVLPGKISELFAAARSSLADSREAAILVGHALKLSRETLYAHPERAVSAAEAERALALVERRAAGEPVAYLTGIREFYGLRLAVTPAVLIPRAETELLVELTLACLGRLAAPAVADIGTGSGAIALALAHARPDAHVIATDRSAEALAVAAANVRDLASPNISLVHADGLASFAPQSFDVIVSNPPYVTAGDPHLREGDLRFEPPEALVAGPDGLAVIRRIIREAKARLKPGGRLILEHGAEQQPAVRKLLAEHDYGAIETYRDLAGLPRAVVARRLQTSKGFGSGEQAEGRRNMEVGNRRHRKRTGVRDSPPCGSDLNVIRSTSGRTTTYNLREGPPFSSFNCRLAPSSPANDKREWHNLATTHTGRPR